MIAKVTLMVKNANDPFALSSACMCVAALVNKIYFDHDVTKAIDVIASFFGGLLLICEKG